MSSRQWMAVCAMIGVTGLVVGASAADAWHGMRNPVVRNPVLNIWPYGVRSSSGPDPSEAALAAVVSAHTSRAPGAEFAPWKPYTFWPDHEGRHFGGASFERDSPAGGLTRVAFASHDWSGVRLEPSLGGAPARMLELAQAHEATLGREDFMLVNAHGWSHHWDDPRTAKGPTFTVSGEHSGYSYQVGADRMVHVRIYAGSTHACVVTIRQEYDARTKTLNVETYFSDAGNASKPIRLIMSETGEVKD
jgi:hypothetical protein